MPTWSLNQAPTWSPNAVATDRGWVDPKSGDLLVACTRLENAVKYEEAFGKGVSQKPKRGGARPGAGRKTDAQRAEIAKQKLENGEKVTEGEAKALEKVEGVKVEPKQTEQPKKKTTRKKKTATRKKAPVKKATVKVEAPVEVKADVSIGGEASE